MTRTDNIHESPALSDRVHVFRDRRHAGRELGSMLAALDELADTVLAAVPAGGVPVAAEVAGMLGLELEVVPVSKITLPWNTEAGYGAVAFDGTVRLNRPLLDRLGLTDAQVAEGIRTTRWKVERRLEGFRGTSSSPHFDNRTAVLIDDGLASGFTMLCAVDAVRSAGAVRIGVAVPTGHREAVELLAGTVDWLVCPNIRGGMRFAVAEAYQHWSDVDESRAIRIFKEYRGKQEQ